MPSAWPILRHAWRLRRLGRRELHGARPTSLKHWSFSLFAAGGLGWYAISPYADSCASCASCAFGSFGVVFARPRIQDIGYITDIEGDLETFNRYVDSDASVLRRENGVLKLKDPASAFVFGGDLFDRGSGDLRLAEELIQLKRTYPCRVFLIMGNRDINKMRLAAELSDSAMRQSSDEAFQAWWDPKAPALTKYLSSKGLSDSKVNRLKWILRHTMGAPAAFEHRRQELAEMSAKSSAEVNDNEVLQSFLESVKSGGAVARYLQHAQIGVILEDTLFVHGAVEESALGFVPSRLTRYTNNTREGLRSLPGASSYEDLHGWIAALNQFAKDEVEAWLQRPDWSQGVPRSRGGEALMAYQSRAASCLLTVVVSCYVDGKNMPTRQAIDQDKMEGFSKCSDPLSQKVVEYLHRGKVRRVVVGHKPSGEAPAILRTSGVDGKGYEVISADTNYASSKDEQMRGESWCEVRISQDLGHSQTRLRGQRPDGLGDYDFKLRALGNDPTGDDGDPLVGHQARYGKQWVWVRLKLKTGDYLLSRGYGRTAEYWAKKASDFQVVDFPPVLQKA